MKYTITINTGNAAMLTPGDVYDAIQGINFPTLRSLTFEAEEGGWSIHQIKDVNGNRVGTVAAEQS